MPDLSAIGVIASSLNTATNIAQAMVGLREASVIQSKVIELQGVILAAQSGALTAQSDQFSLIEKVRQLEQEVASLKGWDAQKEKYELSEISPATFAYALKADSGSPEPSHWLCAACFSDGKKSIIQQGEAIFAGVMWGCPKCRAQVRVWRNVTPSKPPRFASEGTSQV